MRKSTKLNKSRKESKEQKTKRESHHYLAGREFWGGGGGLAGRRLSHAFSKTTDAK